MSSTCAILLLLGLSIGAALKLEIPKINGLKQQSQVLSAENPSNSPVCFDYYRPKLDAISQTYETQYTRCIQTYNTSASLDNDKWKAPRQELVSSGSNACNPILDCSTIVGYVEAFECYAQVGADQSKSMYAISASATATAVDVKQYYATIESQKTLCISSAEKNYVQDTTLAYESLNACLINGSVPTTIDPSTPTTNTIPYSTTEPNVIVN